MGAMGPILAQIISQRLASAKGAEGAPGMAAGIPLGDAGQALAGQLADLKGADPQAGLAKIQSMIQELSALISVYALRIPMAAQSGARALAPLQRMLKEIQQAAQTAQAAGGPLKVSPATMQQPGQLMGAGAPGGSIPFLSR